MLNSNELTSNELTSNGLTSVVGLGGNPAIWQHSIVEMLACAWLLCCDSEANKLTI